MKRGIFLTPVFGISLVVFCFILTVASFKDVAAIPAFARKYQTSCATCHIAFPKMTAFGEAFRRNGFQFPEGTDLQYIKEQPVSLGAEGNKRAFPDAIWPSTIPGTAPFSMIIESELSYNKEVDPKIAFTSFPAEVAVVTGGTFGESIAFYSELAVGEEGVEVERVYASLLNIAGRPSLLNLKVGQFEPGVFYFSNHRRLGPSYLVESFTVGNNQWSLEPTQQGFELYGLMSQGRLGYNIGLVEGRGNIVNTAKDFYGHLTYKVGGLRLDGVAPEGGQPLERTKPWEDNSFIVGGFVYVGKSKLGLGAGEGAALAKSSLGILQQETLNDKFRVFGGDVQIFYDRWNWSGGLAVFDHDNPFLEEPTRSATATVVFGEAQFVVYPWLMPWARFETADVEDATTRRLFPGFTALLRANVRTQLFAEFVKNPGEDFGFEALEGGLAFGF